MDKFLWLHDLKNTLPETNSEFAPENGWLEDEFPFEIASWQVLLLLVSGTICWNVSSNAGTLWPHLFERWGKCKSSIFNNIFPLRRQCLSPVLLTSLTLIWQLIVHIGRKKTQAKKAIYSLPAFVLNGNEGWLVESCVLCCSWWWWWLWWCSQ